MHKSPSYRFPKDFQWGVATASYQIEGATREDGCGPSVWDELSHRSGGTKTGENGDVACDHYHRYEEDVKLMASLGIKHYRFSISWPRVIPGGTGAVNPKGIDFYNRLVDCLLAHGITPHATLFHWDAPLALQQKYGGWLDRQMAHDFADYTTVMVKALGDRVKNWMTINEIPCFTLMGYGVGKRGEHAPGVQVDSMKDVWQTIYHACLAHGLGVRAIRAASPGPCKVSLVDNISATVPVTESPEDVQAAQKAFRNSWCNGGILFPVLTGNFSEEWKADREKEGTMPDVTEGDLEIMSTPVDAFGINMYSGTYYRHADNDDGYEHVPTPEHYPRLDMPWLQMVPESLYWAFRNVREVCGFDKEMFISENGCADQNTLNFDGEVMDLSRILYLRSYLRQVHRAVDEGLPVTGYFQWSFMDNFEWAWGYSRRFGLVYVNYNTQERIPKESARWYAECIRQNRVV
jgi:beta-glucosidase